jgi:hypothetical protein
MKTRQNGLFELLKEMNDHQMKDHGMQSTDLGLIDITDLDQTINRTGRINAKTDFSEITE